MPRFRYRIRGIIAVNWHPASDPSIRKASRKIPPRVRQGVFTLPEFLAQSRIVHAEHDALLDDALAHFHAGLLFFYFSEVDQDSHMLWGKHDTELLNTYRAVDRSIGTVMARAGDASIIVMSDHGFAAFNTAVNLNTWLYREGFLALTGGRGEAIDWKRTRAYAMGLNAIYINLAGREKYGIVHDGTEREAVVSDLIRRLQAFKPAIENVTRLRPNSSRFSPDLIAGYAPGYRASWETALGEVPPDVMTGNNDAWIADHCIAAGAVPGVLISNRAPVIANPELKDLTVTILKEFGASPTPEMKGRAIY